MIILFDLDDTLIDHSRAAHIAVEALHEAHGALLGLPLAEFVARWLALTEQAMEAFARGELSVLEQRRWRVRQMFERPCDDAQADALYARYLEVYQRSWRLFPDVPACLGALSGQRLGIVTNGGRDQQRKKLASTGITQHFELMLTPEPPLRGKPEPDLFFAAAAALRVHPRECVYVGDHLERDVLAAERAGMTGIWLVRESPGGAQPREAGSVQRIASLDELAALL